MDRKKLNTDDLVDHLPEKEDTSEIASEIAKREVELLRAELLRWNEAQDKKLVRLRQDCRIEDVKMLV